MNRFSALALILLATLSFAQDNPRVEIFGGYSLERISTCGPSGSSEFYLCSVQGGKAQANSYNGWNAAATFFAYKFLGFTADFAGHYGTTTVPGQGASGSFSTSRYSYMFGPTVALRSQKIAPFAHALFGRMNNNFGNNQVTEATNYARFAWAVGGGIDMTSNRHWAFRLAQVDYERAMEPFIPNNSTATSSTAVSGFRVSTGIIFRP